MSLLDAINRTPLTEVTDEIKKAPELAKHIANKESGTEVFFNRGQKKVHITHGDDYEDLDADEIRKELERVPGIDQVIVQPEASPPNDESGWEKVAEATIDDVVSDYGKYPDYPPHMHSDLVVQHGHRYGKESDLQQQLGYLIGAIRDWPPGEHRAWSERWMDLLRQGEWEAVLTAVEEVIKDGGWTRPAMEHFRRIAAILRQITRWRGQRAQGVVNMGVPADITAVENLLPQQLQRKMHGMNESRIDPKDVVPVWDRMAEQAAEWLNQRGIPAEAWDDEDYRTGRRTRVLTILEDLVIVSYEGSIIDTTKLDIEHWLAGWGGDEWDEGAVGYREKKEKVEIEDFPAWLKGRAETLKAIAEYNAAEEARRKAEEERLRPAREAAARKRAQELAARRERLAGLQFGERHVNGVTNLSEALRGERARQREVVLEHTGGVPIFEENEQQLVARLEKLLLQKAKEYAAKAAKGEVPVADEGTIQQHIAKLKELHKEQQGGGPQQAEESWRLTQPLVEKVTQDQYQRALQKAVVKVNNQIQDPNAVLWSLLDLGINIGSGSGIVDMVGKESYDALKFAIMALFASVGPRLAAAAKARGAKGKGKGKTGRAGRTLPQTGRLARGGKGGPQTAQQRRFAQQQGRQRQQKGKQFQRRLGASHAPTIDSALSYLSEDLDGLTRFEELTEMGMSHLDQVYDSIGYHSASDYPDDPDAPSCANCLYFVPPEGSQPQGGCTQYNIPVDEEGMCDGFRQG